MAHREKPEVEENAVRITNWLVDNSTEFEQRGLSEESLAAAAKMSTEQAITAVDRLENREVVVRDPIALTRPPRFLVKPGRNWLPTRDKLVAARAAKSA